MYALCQVRPLVHPTHLLLHGHSSTSWSNAEVCLSPFICDGFNQEGRKRSLSLYSSQLQECFGEAYQILFLSVCRTHVSKRAVNLEYLSHLRDAIVRPLTTLGTEGVQDAIAFMDSYCLMKEDVENIMEVTSWGGKPSAFSKLDPKASYCYADFCLLNIFYILF